MAYSENLSADLQQRSFGRIKVLMENHVLTLTLNRPEKRNAFDPWMVNELAFALSHARYNNDVRLVVVAAEGPVFCAGADLKAFSGQLEDNPGSDIPPPESEVRIGDLFRLLHKPCIAKVQGPVYAGGFLLIGGCTHVVSSNEAVFGLPEVKRGLWPMQVMASLSANMRPRDLLDWCIRGRVLSAQQAFDLGLITALTDKADLNADVKLLSEDILAQSPTAIRFGLQAWDEMQEIPFAERHKYLQGMLHKILTSEDAREGLLAFREKRNPVWTGN